MRDNVYVKNRLKEVLARRKHSHVKLSQEIGVSEIAVSNWVNDRDKISDVNLRKLCCYLKIGPEKLIYLDFTEFKKSLENKNDQIQTSNNPRDRKDKGDGG